MLRRLGFSLADQGHRVQPVVGDLALRPPDDLQDVGAIDVVRGHRPGRRGALNDSFATLKQVRAEPRVIVLPAAIALAYGLDVHASIQPVGRAQRGGGGRSNGRPGSVKSPERRGV